jgi:hypothetical protein
MKTGNKLDKEAKSILVLKENRLWGIILIYVTLSGIFYMLKNISTS